MTLIDEFRKLEARVREIWKLLMAIRAAGGGGGGPHNVLSGTHTDSTAAAAVRGDVIVADSNPKWKRLAKGAVGDVLTSGAADVAWAAPAGGTHNLLSATHPDALADSPIRGDILVGNSTPKWARKAKGTSGHLLGYDANDVVAINPNTLDVDKVDGQHAAAFQAAGVVPAHHGSHEGAGGGAGADKIKLDDLDTPDDNTDLDFSTARHGLCSKAPNDTSKFLRGDATWQQVTSGGASTLILWNLDAFPASPTAQSDHFEDAALAAKWTEWDPGGLITISEADHHVKFAKSNTNPQKWAGMFQTLPAGDCTITMRAPVLLNTNATGYLICGIGLFQDATNNPNTSDMMFIAAQADGAFGYGQASQKWSQWDTYSSNLWNAGVAKASNPTYVRARRNGTTWYLDASPNGFTWHRGYTFTEGGHYAPAEFGIVVCNFNVGATCNIWVDWIKYEAADNFSPPGREVTYWVS